MQRTINRYVLLEQVGSTGLATVYKAQAPNQEGFVALKVLRPYMCNDEALLDRSSREMKRVAELRHPNILPIYGQESEGDVHWIAMQHVSWPTLRQWMQQPIPASQAMIILKQVAAAVEAARDVGIHHGDIKPGNIFLDPETGQVLLADFGIALLGEGAPSGMRMALKTPLPTYTAPELGQASAPNILSDVYSIGVLAYDMLTGTVPFNALERSSVQARQLTSFPPLPSRVNPNIPSQLDAVILKALASHPERRYETPSDFVAAMAAAAPIPDPTAAPFRITEALEAQSEFPGMGSAEAAPAVEAGPPVICTVCGHRNAAGSYWCRECWGVLNRVAAAEGQEVLTSEEREAKRNKSNRVRLGLIGSGLAAVCAVMMVQFLNITLPLPATSSNITALSGPGEWAMIYRTTEGPGQVPGESAAIAGRVKWTFETSDPIVSTPAVKEGRLYLTTQDNRVVALDAATGSTIWERSTVAPVDSSPAVADGMVFFGVRNKRVMALDADTGEIRWEFVTNQNPTSGSPLVKDGVVYIGSGDGRIYALDALTGAERWSHATRDWIANTPALSDDLLVVSSFDGRVTIYDTDTGKRRFSFRGFNQLVMGSPVISGESVFIPYRNGLVTSVNIKEKEVLFYSRWYRVRLQLWLWGMIDHPGLPKGVEWVYRTGSPIDTTPAADAEKVYVPAAGGKLHAIDSTNGKKVWIFSTEADQLSTPTLVENLVIVSDSKGKLYGIDKDSGEEQWALQIADSLTSTPVLAGGVMYLASKDGVLYAVE